MVIAIDFDGVVVKQSHPFQISNLEMMNHAKESLMALRRAGHILVLYSCRSNKNIINPEFDPLVREGIIPPLSDHAREIGAQKYRQMLQFVNDNLPDIFHAIDDGRQGKIQADMYIDNKAFLFGPGGAKWPEIAYLYGEQHVEGEEGDNPQE